MWCDQNNGKASFIFLSQFPIYCSTWFWKQWTHAEHTTVDESEKEIHPFWVCSWSSCQNNTYTPISKAWWQHLWHNYFPNLNVYMNEILEFEPLLSHYRWRSWHQQKPSPEWVSNNNILTKPYFLSNAMRAHGQIQTEERQRRSVGAGAWLLVHASSITAIPTAGQPRAEPSARTNKAKLTRGL